jgi:hypothetical protein
MRGLFFLLAGISISFSTPSWAQDSGGGSSRAHQVGAFVGRMLPHKVDGAEEIFGLSGLRYSMPLGSGDGFADAGAMFGNSEGVKWQGIFVTASMQMPIETLVGHAGIGADYTMYEGSGGVDKASGGLHFVGGVMNRLGGNALARFDMKLSSSPGTTLFFALGLVIELDGGAGGGGE